MISTLTKQIFSIGLSSLLVITSSPLGAGAQQPAPAESGAGAAPFTANDLQQLVAPIALYPDSLVAQVLGAATFPDQVQAADGWLQQNKNLTGDALMKAVDKQAWDPSVKALTQFPSVMSNLVKNLTWTSTLGEAYHNQPTDVMAAVQVLRAQAKKAGNLKSGEQIKVVQESPEVIVIQPANPQVIYVPQYNPTVVYGTPYQPPGYSTADVVAASVLAFGVGIAVGAAINNSCCGWGYSYWNCNWHGGTVVYSNRSYYGNAGWSGGVYRQSVTSVGPGGVAQAGRAYNSNTGTYARGASVSTPYGSRAAGEAYNPETGAYGATRQASNAYGNAGSSVVTKDGETARTQHVTTAAGTAGAVETSNGGRAAASSGVNGNYAAGQGANGDKFAAANGNVYKNTGSGWQQTQGTPHNQNLSAQPASAESRGYGGQQHSGASAMGGSSGWQSRAESARGSASRSGGGRRR
ncbi:MAG TPA: DUF3300 domain-containing protein [Terracidiphilus sp.]|jgi:hypothetical protein|nr:DUF3300 domain-containing protein [Terracidiphilus sp.]